MMKPASPRTGGMIWPEVEATASIAPAMFGRNPRCFIIGMVRRPVSTTFATAWPHHRGDDAAADDGREGGAAPHVVAGDLSDLDDELEHAHAEQDRGVDDQEVDVVRRDPCEPEHPFGKAEAQVVHDEVRVVLGQHEQGNRHPIPEEEVDDGDEDERREQSSPVQPVEQQHTGEKDETHVEVDLLEEGVDLVQPDRVDAHVERACDPHRRAEHEEPDPEPELERKAARLGVFCDQHLHPVNRAEEHDREHEVRVVHLRVRDEPEGGEADVGREHGAAEDEHRPRHVGELRGVHCFRAAGLASASVVRGRGPPVCTFAGFPMEETGPARGRAGPQSVSSGFAYCG